jgi:hypothetical protein
MVGFARRPPRGELEVSLPVGLDRGEDGRIALSADEQVRRAIGRVFELWRRLGSARQVVICLRDEGRRLPRRTVAQRRVRWMPASYRAVHAFLTNPAYAGEFVFGRTAQKRELNEQGRVRRRTVTDRGVVRLPARAPSRVCQLAGVLGHPRAAAPEREAARRGRRRRPRGAGAAAGDRALRALRAADSGRLLGQRRPLADLRVRARVSSPPRQAPVPVRRRPAADDAIAAAFLEAVTTAGMRACTEAVGELERQHEERLQGQRLAVERAEFEAGRAERQFDACEPENRLVARTLERAWEQALSRLESERLRLAELDARRPEPPRPPSAKRSRGWRRTFRASGTQRRLPRGTARRSCGR